MSATPIKNNASDVIHICNFLLPVDRQLQYNKMFKKNDAGKEIILPNAVNYLKDHLKKYNAYISYLRGTDPLTFPLREDMGVIPSYLEYTHIIPCPMEKFQEEIYYQEYTKEDKDTLARGLQNMGNIIFPTIEDRKLKMLNGNKGLEIFKYVVENDTKLLTELLKKKIKLKVEYPFINYNKKTNELSGHLLRSPWLNQISCKFGKMVKEISRCVKGDRGHGNILIYSQFVGVGVNIIANILKENGYTNHNYIQDEFTDKQICYICGKKLKGHNNKDHEFESAKFAIITGDSGDETNISNYDEKA